MMRLLLCLAFVAGAAVQAKTPQPEITVRDLSPPVASPAAANLAAAKPVVKLVLPPAAVQGMVERLAGGQPMQAFRDLERNPEFQAALANDPRVRGLRDKAFARSEAEMRQITESEIAGLQGAMTVAYARNFNVQELADMERFFSSPTGKSYIAKSATLASAPELGRWALRLSSLLMQHKVKQAELLRTEIEALSPPR